ncbi:Toll-Interleukin-Resistance domain-containing protein [Arabidopsis lyrata subsp. lyrata]|uniref:Toll-Interleukin-Resistance domain-containing protein n=1 Tax=Arabidopsis lyrata subsp. lyrata TaxID=81972 RepID=D7MLF8_ARALL|nr:protein PHLOEM PROTEIN 2-LIKE A8 [Arabidopsis lyrata subsp. lyrata]EFH41577.1 Toll-Interleukin-Resistance domain-containing protein [Arabidopsis lyrata subsp. lyrata]|eukprot:XP_002865318.1 protein PHLOEM PROTEIN 2-LIKE A8 [Arabidopsis lyrata subsp. lyrata]
MAEPRPYQRPPQVFISFHGDELRDNFIRYLVWGLRDERVNVFIDRAEANRRDIRNISTKIEESNIAVIIFSKRYTESEMCLNEHQKMHEHVKQSNLKVIPVFYDVSISDVKNLEGEFGNHFEEMKMKYANDPLKILNWENSLSSIVERTGLTSEEHGTGLGLVMAIVRAVKSELTDSLERRKIMKGQVFVLASAAVFIFSLFVARLLCTDVKVYKAVKCLLGFLVLVGVLHQLYCLRKHPNR